MSHLADIRIRLRDVLARSEEEEEEVAAQGDYDPYIDWDILATGLRLDNGRKRFKNPMVGPQSQGWSDCRLQSLPVECYQACLQYLDIASLTDMRRLSQFTRYAIDSLYQYQEIYEHAPQLLRACLGTAVAPRIPLLRLHEALTTMECYYCKQSDPSKPRFGTNLSLYECRRACIFCLRNNEHLAPFECMTLTSLCSQRNTSIDIVAGGGLKPLRTIFDKYGPSRTLTKKNTLLLSSSIVTKPGKTLSDKEYRAIHGNDRASTSVIYHHPLVRSEDESQIGLGTISPVDAPKRATNTYLSAIQLPYLTSSSKTREYGVPCNDCMLHMRYEEERWKRIQQNRRWAGQSTLASDRTRARINKAREIACRYYISSEEALHEPKEWDRTSADDGGRWMKLSIQEHKLYHKSEKMHPEEREWRAKVKAQEKAWR